tara:strand:- start:879 stop:2255 length:1377 start_codon:yes stop_codon:yes gene_type:complete
LQINKSDSLTFLFISSSDLHGGASIAGYRLHRSLCDSGYKSTMIVKNKISNDKTVIELNGFISFFLKGCINGEINFPLSYRFGILIRAFYNYFYRLLKITGREIFFFPASRKILKMINYSPDIIHLHNIHGDYLNISILKNWSKKSKIVITLHDLWLFTGHCGVPINCDRFHFTCGDCPDLTLPPKINKDKTRKNILYKKKIINKVPINYIAPSNWVYDQVSDIQVHPRSNFKIIHNSINTKMYFSFEKRKKRLELGLPNNKKILLTCSVGFKLNPYKDLKTILKALIYLTNKDTYIDNNILLLIIGEREQDILPNTKNIKYIQRTFNEHLLSQYYNAADIYINASHIETWGLTISEALSSGLPVLASNVGGIPEQVRGYKYEKNDFINKYNLDEANGMLFPNQDEKALSALISYLFYNNDIIETLGNNARRYAKDNLDVSYSIQKHLDYYFKIYKDR